MNVDLQCCTEILGSTLRLELGLGLWLRLGDVSFYYF